MRIPTHEELEDLLKADLLETAKGLADYASALGSQAAAETERGDLYIQYAETAGIPGGAVHNGWVHKNPQLECFKVAHRHISEAAYLATAERYRVNW